MGDEQVEVKPRAGTSESSHQGLGSKTITTNTKRNLQVMKGKPGRNFLAGHANCVAQMRREPV